MMKYMPLLAGVLLSISAVAATVDEKRAVLETYSNIAYAGYEDSLITARTLQNAIATFLANPTDDTLAAAKTAWIAARVPYQQTEVYRFGNAVVDDWEGKVNAWPLDEGLIDYVDAGAYGSESDENEFYVANIVANAGLTIGGVAIDASNIDASLVESLHEIGDVEANVATGYHAIEFLLWGQDLNGAGPGPGARPVTDYDTENCSNGNCDRRGAYLTATTALLVSDLADMVVEWAPDGGARAGLLEGDADVGLGAILTGMGSLSFGELAGERIQLGLLLHDPEEEHDCFSDNTHNSHFYDQAGIANVYRGSYTRIDGTTVTGVSLAFLVGGMDKDADRVLQSRLVFRS